MSKSLVTNSNPIAPLFPLAITSMSLGRAQQHDLKTKLTALSGLGVNGIELFYEDIKLPARQKSGDFSENVLEQAKNARQICDELGLDIICLQPFKNYDGRLDSKRHAQKLKKVELWFKICKILRTDIIQVATQFLGQGTTGEDDIIVKDLLELAQLGAAENPPIKFAYEAMAWGFYNDRWQDVWRLVQKVDMPNFGILMDTFHVAAKVWADVTTPTGLLPNHETRLQNDLKEFLQEVPVEKIFLIQVCDAERITPPLKPGHPWWLPTQKANMTWSRNARLFPYETAYDGYLPVEELVKSWIFDLGYRGWISLEVYHRDLTDPSPELPTQYAHRAVKSWETMVNRLRLNEVR
ncbi:xylose isomerase-like protein [Lipomyces japonicus]|uniref:xylose isomerase-like protein n=1 Tax=Lipomyces japonicus TaxID=56871 RepID=UPI0034CFE320